MALRRALIAVPRMKSIGSCNSSIKWSAADELDGYRNRIGSIGCAVARYDTSLFDRICQQGSDALEKWVVRMQHVGLGGPEGMFPRPRQQNRQAKTATRKVSL